MTKDFMVFRPSKRRVFVRALYSLFICCTFVVELFVGLSDENVLHRDFPLVVLFDEKYAHRDFPPFPRPPQAATIATLIGASLTT